MWLLLMITELLWPQLHELDLGDMCFQQDGAIYQIADETNPFIIILNRKIVFILIFHLCHPTRILKNTERKKKMFLLIAIKG